VLVSDPLVAALPVWASFPHRLYSDRALKGQFIVKKKKKKKIHIEFEKKKKMLL
jgi:hypothetical protein